ATAMDSVLPVINRSNPPDISIIAFYSGLVITIVVPILVPAVVAIFNLG
ncbi:MAG TPA: lysine exporter LysO family protein, partial [Fusobacterium ulcerans]|nr:lysine exporter LysO family protein [Fusobacterium ulcerans]